MVQSSNPVLARGFGQGQQHATWNTAPAPSAGDLDEMYSRPAYVPPARFMTLDDVVLRTAATLGVVVVTGAIAWIANLQGLAIVGALVGFVLALVIAFKQSTNPALILTYAAAEGVFLGAISRVFNDVFGGGIVIQAVVGTMGVFAGMLVVYKTGAIRVTPKLTRWILGALIGVLVLVVANWIASIFIPGVWSSSCLLMLSVTGCNRVPAPPASTIPLSDMRHPMTRGRSGSVYQCGPSG